MNGFLRRVLWFMQGFLLLLAAWALLSLLFSQRLIPPPWLVLPRFVQLLGQSLLPHAMATLVRTLLSVLVSLLLALPAGILLARFRTLDRLFLPSVYILHPVPKIALFPVVLLIFGMNDLSKVAVVTLVLFFQMVLEIRGSARLVPEEYFTAIRSLGAGRRQQLRFVVLPCILPQVFSALRIGAGTALAVLFFAETFFADSGLGYFIMDSWMRISYTDMFAGILMLGLLGAALYTLLDLFERLLCPWLKAGRNQ